MADPASPAPDPPPLPPPGGRAYDPLAVAVGNASLLGVGYLMLGRRRLALAAAAVTVVLVCVLAWAARSVWFEAIVLAWWAAVIGHGWYLASRRGGPAPVRKPWRIALGAAVPVVLAFGLLRFDASRIEGGVADARQGGDCARVLSGQDQAWLGDIIADSPLTARGDATVRACGRLRAAQAALDTGLSGNTGSLASGFATLNSLLAGPGNEAMVQAALNGFWGKLPAGDPCHTAVVTDWLFDRQPSGNILDRSVEVAARAAPAALDGCGDQLMADQNWPAARSRYQQLLDQYPGNGYVARAQAGVTRATQNIELDNVRQLLQGPADQEPRYCSAPARYSGAAPYGRGTNRALFYGNTDYTGKLPSGWRTTDPVHARLVVCEGGQHQGGSVQTCSYHSEDSSARSYDVTFHKIAIPVKAYELRTGKLVYDGTVQISGASCPEHISYTYPAGHDPGPAPDENVKPSAADVRAAFSPVINR